MDARRDVGLNVGFGVISYLARGRSPRGSREIKVKLNALCAASIRSLRSFLFLAYFSRAARCERLLLTMSARARSRDSRRAVLASETLGRHSAFPGISSFPVPSGIM